MKYLIAMSLVVSLLIGCSTVTTKQPIGTEPYSPSKQEWEGTWLSDDEIIIIMVIDEKKGIIKLAWIEDKDPDFKLETVTCKLMKSQNGMYINALNIPGEDFGGYYIWGKIQIKNDKIIIWPPLFEAFKSAYEENKVKALVEKRQNQKTGLLEISDIKLTDEPSKILLVIENNNKYFDWENPIVLVRLIEK